MTTRASTHGSHARRIQRTAWYTTASVLALTATATHAHDKADALDHASPVQTVSQEELELASESTVDDILDALKNGKVHVNIRVRAEIADADGSQTSQAYTTRLRLGYETQEYNGLSAYVEVEDIRTADDDRYNAAGLNSNPTHTVIADPEDTELNQAYLKFTCPETGAKFTIGRQRLILDDARFIGNVGWRQNEQTFDAATVRGDITDELSFIYSFLWDVNRIFGPDADRDFTSESHLINFSHTGLPIGTVTAFAYLLDFDGHLAPGAPSNTRPAARAGSSNTVGLRVTGKNDINDNLALAHVISYAHQTDAADNPTDYDADYFLIEGTLKQDNCFAGAGYEVLGSDSGVIGFATPLATGHKFNGWADVFLTTPAAGLQDFYLQAGTELPCGIKGKVVYHWFWSEEGGGRLGNELDIQGKKALNENVSVLAKFATFDGKGAFADIRRFWLQMDVTF